MKKFILSIFVLFLFVGCDNLMNTPTKRVEEFLSRYQTTDSRVMSQLDDTLSEEGSFNSSQRDTYRDIMKKQYENLTYTIKDESVDGDTSIVKVEIEVYDYNKVIKEANNYLMLNQDEFIDQNNNIDNTKFNNYKLERLKEVNDRVKYTLDLSLTKNDKAWRLDDITEIDRQKIHGIYSY